MQEFQQRLLICIELFERPTFDARNNRGDQPLRLTHFDHGYDCRILLEGGEGSARIKNLRHEALHLVSVDGVESATTLTVRPIGSHATVRGHKAPREDGTHLPDGVFQPASVTVTHPTLESVMFRSSPFRRFPHFTFRMAP